MGEKLRKGEREFREKLPWGKRVVTAPAGKGSGKQTPFKGNPGRGGGEQVREKKADLHVK